MDSVANMLTSLINAQRVGRERAAVPYSNFNKDLLTLLKDKGYIAKVDVREGAHKYLMVTLAYDGKVARLQHVRRLSSPGQRVYVKKDEIPYAADGMGMVIVSTSQGVVDDVKARKEGLGGELICEIW